MIEDKEQTAGTPMSDPEQLPDLPILGIPEEFGDPETLLNSRDWLRSALEAKGAKINGGGMGCGQADLDIVLEGCRFNVSIRPLG